MSTEPASGTKATVLAADTDMSRVCAGSSTSTLADRGLYRGLGTEFGWERDFEQHILHHVTERLRQ